MKKKKTVNNKHLYSVEVLMINRFGSLCTSLQKQSGENHWLGLKSNKIFGLIKFKMAKDQWFFK